MKKGIVCLVLCLIISVGLASCGGSGGNSNPSPGGSSSDTTAPSVPTGLTAAAASSSSVALNWTASTDEVGVTGYKILRNGTQISTSTTNSFEDTGLTSSTTYTYTVSAYDAAANNSAQSSEASAATLGAGTTADTQAPTVPTNLLVNAASSTQINLVWTASTDDVAVSGYKIYRDGTYLITATTISTLDSGLTASTNYCYTVSAFDSANNESSQSSQACATTSRWTTRASGTTSSLNGIAWSGTQFVAVGDSGSILTSPDGVTWTTRTSSTTNYLNGIAWSGTQFVAVGDSGSILTSSDGVTWTSRTSGTTDSLSGIAWSGTQFVVVGRGWYDDILTSPDGISWTAPRKRSFLKGIAWSGTLFVAVGAYCDAPCTSSIGSGGINYTNSGAVTTSPDGITWTYLDLPATIRKLLGITWSGTQFVAVGSSGSILTSPDGVTWTTRTSGTTNCLNGIAWSGTQFVAVGASGSILTSPDGIIWSAQTPGTIQRLSGIAWSGTKYVAIGDWGIILTSP